MKKYNMSEKNIIKKAAAFAGKNMLGTITNVSVRQNAAALTFDDGPCPAYTVPLLNLLEKYKVKATFFLVGRQTEKFPYVVKRIIDAGHAIGNHSWNHPSFPLIDARERVKQILKCKKAMLPYKTNLFRPPYGHQNVASRIEAFLLGYKVIAWNIAAEDWLNKSSQEMAEAVIARIQPGSIILFHDYLYTTYELEYIAREQAFGAIEIILKTLSGNFKFVTVPELLKMGKSVRQNWYSQEEKNFTSKLKMEQTTNV